jgi:broad specificity phosphatase PhoE
LVNGRVVYLARHGETEWNRVGRWQGKTDIPLSDVGRAQAQALRERVRGRGIVRVYASDLGRARETADIVAAALGLTPVTLDERLRERGFGCFEGLTRLECERDHPEAWARYLADRRSTPPDAEPQPEVVARMMSALTDIAAATPDAAAVLAVSHGGAIRSFVHAITGLTPPPLDNGALLRARFQDGRFIAADLETAHSR